MKMLKQIESEKEALSLARNAVENAAVRGPWMSMVWCLSEGEVKADRTSWAFPKEKLPEVLDGLKKAIAELEGGVVEESPLPTVSLPPAVIPMPQLRESVGKAMEAAEEKTPYPAEACMEVPSTPDDLLGVVEVVDDPSGD